MKLRPNRTEFEQWLSCVPQDGDLIFLSEDKRNIFSDFPFPIFSQNQVKAQGLLIWTLNCRSWYGYALNQADYCVWLPKGVIEELPESKRALILQEQIRYNVPTVIGNQWITSLIWTQLSIEEQIYTMERWTTQNETPEYESIDFISLSIDVKTELVRVGYDKLINRFPTSSGPNCFATAAGAIVETNRQRIYSQWMHWPIFEQHLLEQGFKVISSSLPQKGDILVFTKKTNSIHAAYSLGEEFYFEKPGQDFYEPYRIGLFRNWQTDWPETKLTLWRKVKFYPR